MFELLTLSDWIVVVAFNYNFFFLVLALGGDFFSLIETKIELQACEEFSWWYRIQWKRYLCLLLISWSNVYKFSFGDEKAGQLYMFLEERNIVRCWSRKHLTCWSRSQCPVVSGTFHPSVLPVCKQMAAPLNLVNTQSKVKGAGGLVQWQSRTIK